jgi:3-oxoacyl-[acyl-carrier-protein] synthase III
VTALRSVSAYLPPTSVPVREYLTGFGLPAEWIRVQERFFGFAEIRLEPATPWAEQARAAAAGLDDTPDWRPRVRYLFQARTMPVAAPYPVAPLQELRDALGVPPVTAVCITQLACASALFAVDLAGRLLEQAGDPEALALLVMGEKAFTTQPDVIADTGVMGEGTAAVLVAADGDRDRVLGYATRSYGDLDPDCVTLADAGLAFRALYGDALVEVMHAALEAAGLGPPDVDLVLPHNANRMSWLRIARRAGLDGLDRVFLDNLPRTGHCFGADAFLNYSAARDCGRLRRGDRYLMTAVGLGTSFSSRKLGATFSAMVLQH